MSTEKPGKRGALLVDGGPQEILRKYLRLVRKRLALSDVEPPPMDYRGAFARQAPPVQRAIRAIAERGKMRRESRFMSADLAAIRAME